MKVIDCKQGTPEWIAARLGKVTASEINALVSPELKIRTGQGPRTYLYEKLCEKVLGRVKDTGETFAMQQGSVVELEAIPWFAFEYNTPIERVGFCASDDGRIGFSPDGLIGDEGGIEVKSPQPAKHLEYLIESVVPSDYRLQVQFSLYVSRRKWWKFVSYSRQLPALVKHVEPDPEAFEAIDEALSIFLSLFDARLEQIAAMKARYEDPRKAEYEAKIKRWEETGEIP